MGSRAVRAMGSCRHHILMATVKQEISTVTTELLQHLDGGLSASYQCLMVGDIRYWNAKRWRDRCKVVSCNE